MSELLNIVCTHEFLNHTKRWYGDNICQEIPLPTPFIDDFDINSLYNTIITVQPLTAPTGQCFTFHKKYKSFGLSNTIKILGVG